MLTTAAMLAAKNNVSSDEWLTPTDVWADFKTVLKEDDVVWEPFVSKLQHLSKDAWTQLDVPCIETTTDFFTQDMPKDATVLVSNPPFSKKFQVVEHCLQHKELKFALLLPSWVFASATVRKIIYKTSTTDIALIVPKKRVHYVHPHTLKQMKKTNFDSAFISRGILPAGVHYL